MRGWLVLLSLALASSVPVYVMMPLDLVSLDGKVDVDATKAAFAKMKDIGVDGVMIDVWWGIVEKDAPMMYDWSPYELIAQLCQDARLKLQTVLSFHQCGGNVGDTCNIPLPPWVTDVAKSNPDIFYTDMEGNRNPEYLSLGVDEVELLQGRTPIQAYADFMESYSRTMADYFGNTIVQVMVGLGPAGELRYPAYPSSRWQFPGVGEFQCYDRYMQADLKQAGANVGHPEWATAPTDAGKYNDSPENTRFFADNGGFSMDYGQFFLTWYSQSLVKHGKRVLEQANRVFGSTEGLTIAGKIAGIHWLYATQSHAAELTAGYYNIAGRDGYNPIISMFAANNVSVDFTCLEMTNNDNPGARSLPEDLVRQVFGDTINAGLEFGGENALARYDDAAYHQILQASQLNGHVLDGFTYLRWTSDLQQQNNWNTFGVFVSNMHDLSVATLRQRLVDDQKPKNRHFHHLALLPRTG